jgi:hypothetical protein
VSRAVIGHSNLKVNLAYLFGYVAKPLSEFRSRNRYCAGMPTAPADEFGSLLTAVVVVVFLVIVAAVAIRWFR